MTVRVNGIDAEFATMRTARELVASMGFAAERVAVAVNGEIIPKNRLDAVTIEDRDVVDVISPVAGG